MAKRATPDGAGKRVPLMARTTIALRASLAASASENGVSLAHEVERRLEASYAEDRMRVIAREEMQAAIVADREAQRVELMKRAVSDGRGGWMASNNDLAAIVPVPESQKPRPYNNPVLQHLAETAPERTAGYLRKAMKDPAVKAAMHQRYELNGKQ